MEMIPGAKNLSSLHRSFVSRCLKSEINVLQSVLKIMEQSKRPEDSHITALLKSSAANLKDLAKFLAY